LPINKSVVEMHVKFQGGTAASTLGNKLAASLAEYQPANHDHPAGYLLMQVGTPRGIDTKPDVVDAQGQIQIYTPLRHAWLKPGCCFLVSQVEYEQLRGGSSWKQFASTIELVTHLKTEKTPGSGNDLRVSIHQRLLKPAIEWTVLLLGIPILLSRPDRHMFWVAGMSLLMVGGFTAIVMGMGAVGASGCGLTPHLASWLPLLIFLPWGWAKTWQAFET
jgi:lipopolysaccharide export system permease protein